MLGEYTHTHTHRNMSRLTQCDSRRVMCLCADVALRREVEGDLVLGDMGQGMPFRPGMFDGCIRYELVRSCVRAESGGLESHHVTCVLLRQYFSAAVAV